MKGYQKIKHDYRKLVSVRPALFLLLIALIGATAIPTAAQTTAEASSSNRNSISGNAIATSMEELYQVVKKNSIADSEANKKRIQEFERARDQQRNLLAQENSEVERLEALGKQLNSTIANNESDLTALEKQLSDDLGNFSELFGVTRQVAGDTRAQIENSLVSAEFPQRDVELENIAATQSLPTIEQLRSLWAVLLQEQIQQGRISKFDAEITDENGLRQTASVVRLGPFSIVSDNKFLRSNDDKQLAYLSTQPASLYQNTAQQISHASAGQLVSVVIDPSRGVILDLLPQIPNLIDQFHQGGAPGYLVTILGIIGIAIGLQRIVSLWLTTLKVQAQIKSDQPSNKNPLGRVLNTYHENTVVDIETLEIKLEDAVLKEVPKLDRGLNTLKVLAAVAPLMGLLGTVIGMIVTFQTITLWGADDVKLMAGGISQALVTTVQGLIAAIPLLLLHSVANGRARILQQILEEQSAGLIAAKAEATHATN